MSKSVFVLLVIVALFSSCKLFRKKGGNQKDAVARVYDKYLYLDDLAGIVPANASKQDSLAVTKNYINNWIHQRVVLHKAESNLDDEKKDVDRQLQEYRNSLIRYAYESELVRQRLDTNVSDKEIETFY